MEDIHGICISEQPWAITPNILLHAFFEASTTQNVFVLRGHEHFPLRHQKQLHTDNIL